MFGFRLIAEKKQIEHQTSHITKTLEKRIKELEEELETAKRQVAATVCGADVKKEKIETKIAELEQKIRKEKEEQQVSKTTINKTRRITKTYGHLLLIRIGITLLVHILT